MKKAKLRYKYMVNIKWSEEDQVYIAEMPELPGCATHGKTYDEAVRHAQDAIESWIDGAKESGFAIPEPVARRKFSGRFMTRIDPMLHKALAMRAKESGKTLNRLVQEIIERGV